MSLVCYFTTVIRPSSLLQVRSLGDKPDEALGPGSYSWDVPAVGPQPLSPKRSLPQHKFSTMTREQGQRCYLSPEHAREQIGRTGADKLYSTVPSLGHQPLSGKRNQPAFTWAREDRLRNMFEKAANVSGCLYGDGCGCLVMNG